MNEKLINLLPCPFCGLVPTIKNDAETGYSLFLCPEHSPCRSGTGPFTAFITDRSNDAIAWWNRREYAAQNAAGRDSTMGRHTERATASGDSERDTDSVPAAPDRRVATGERRKGLVKTQTGCAGYDVYGNTRTGPADRRQAPQPSTIREQDSFGRDLREANLATMVKRLAHCLREDNEKLRSQAFDLLKRMGLLGPPLRSEYTEEQTPKGGIAEADAELKPKFYDWTYEGMEESEPGMYVSDDDYYRLEKTLRARIEALVRERDSMGEALRDEVTARLNAEHRAESAEARLRERGSG